MFSSSLFPTMYMKLLPTVRGGSLSFLLRGTRGHCEEGLSLLLRSTHRHCEEEGRGANPSSSEVPGDEVEGHLENVRKRGKRAIPLPPKYPLSSLMKLVDLGGGERVSPPPVRVTKNSQPWVMPHRTREIKNLSSSWHLKHSELCNSRH